MIFSTLNDWVALLFGLIFIAVGIAVLWFLKQRNIEATGPFITVFLLGAAIFLVLSGRLQSFRVGDFEATLAAVARAPVTVSKLVVSEVAISPSDMIEVRSGIRSMLKNPRPVILLRVADWNFPVSNLKELDLPAFWLGYEIQSALIASQLRAVIVVDDRDRPLGVFEPAFFSELLRIPFSGSQTPVEKIARLKQTEFWTLLLNPAVNSTKLGKPSWALKGTSNIEALRLMRAKNWEVLAIVDEQLTVTGVATRKGIHESLTLGLVTAPGK